MILGQAFSPQNTSIGASARIVQVLTMLAVVGVVAVSLQFITTYSSGVEQSELAGLRVKSLLRPEEGVSLATQGFLPTLLVQHKSQNGKFEDLEAQESARYLHFYLNVNVFDEAGVLQNKTRFRSVECSKLSSGQSDLFLWQKYAPDAAEAPNRSFSKHGICFNVTDTAVLYVSKKDRIRDVFRSREIEISAHSCSERPDCQPLGPDKDQLGFKVLVYFPSMKFTVRDRLGMFFTSPTSQPVLTLENIPRSGGLRAQVSSVLEEVVDSNSQSLLHQFASVTGVAVRTAGPTSADALRTPYCGSDCSERNADFTCSDAQHRSRDCQSLLLVRLDASADEKVVMVSRKATLLDLLVKVVGLFVGLFLVWLAVTLSIVFFSSLLTDPRADSTLVPNSEGNQTQVGLSNRNQENQLEIKNHSPDAQPGKENSQNEAPLSSNAETKEILNFLHSILTDQQYKHLFSQPNNQIRPPVDRGNNQEFQIPFHHFIDHSIGLQNNSQNPPNHCDSRRSITIIP